MSQGMLKKSKQDCQFLLETCRVYNYGTGTFHRRLKSRQIWQMPTLYLSMSGLSFGPQAAKLSPVSITESRPLSPAFEFIHTYKLTLLATGNMHGITELKS